MRTITLGGSHLSLQIRILHNIIFRYVKYHSNICNTHIRNVRFTRKNIMFVKSWNNVFTLMFHNIPYFKEKSIIMTREIMVTNHCRYFDFLFIVGNYTLLMEVDDCSHNDHYHKINDVYKNKIADHHGFPLYRIDVRKYPNNNINLRYFV
jgi:hypothetical protein